MKTVLDKDWSNMLYNSSSNSQVSLPILLSFIESYMLRSRYISILAYMYMYVYTQLYLTLPFLFVSVLYTGFQLQYNSPSFGKAPVEKASQIMFKHILFSPANRHG